MKFNVKRLLFGSLSPNAKQLSEDLNNVHKNPRVQKLRKTNAKRYYYNIYTMYAFCMDKYDINTLAEYYRYIGRYYNAYQDVFSGIFLSFVWYQISFYVIRFPVKGLEEYQNTPIPTVILSIILFVAGIFLAITFLPLATKVFYRYKIVQNSDRKVFFDFQCELLEERLLPTKQKKDT